MLCDAMFALYLVFLPSLLSVDLETDDASVIDYVDDDPSLPEQPGKPPL